MSHPSEFQPAVAKILHKTSEDIKLTPNTIECFNNMDVNDEAKE